MGELTQVTFFDRGISVDLCDRLERAGYRFVTDLNRVSASRLIRAKVFHFRNEALVLALALSGLPLAHGLAQWNVEAVLRELGLEAVPAHLLRKATKPREKVELEVPVIVPADVWNKAVHRGANGAHYRKPRFRRGF